MNQLEGERFQLQTKYEMLSARNEEQEKLLKEKNDVIRNLKQGLQLNNLPGSEYNATNSSNNTLGEDTSINDNPDKGNNVADIYQVVEANGESVVGIRDEAMTNEVELNAKLVKLKEKIEGKLNMI